MKQLNPEIICNDSTTLSVQASTGHYCTPRQNEGPYTHVEVGYPSVVPHEAMLVFIDRQDADPTETVYGHVPIEIVEEFINLHGGIKKGKIPS